MARGNVSKEAEAIIEAIQASKSTDGPDPARFLNMIILGILTVVGLLVWNNATQTPATLSAIQTQVLEIKSYMSETTDSIRLLNTKLDRNQEQTSEQHARISALEEAMNANKEALKELESYERH